jgi:hypothetical protein
VNLANTAGRENKVCALRTAISKKNRRHCAEPTVCRHAARLAT